MNESWWLRGFPILEKFSKWNQRDCYFANWAEKECKILEKFTGISSELRPEFKPEVRPEVRQKFEKSSFFIRKLFEHTEYKRVGVTRIGIHGQITFRPWLPGPNIRTGTDKLVGRDFISPIRSPDNPYLYGFLMVWSVIHILFFKI